MPSTVPDTAHKILVSLIIDGVTVGIVLAASAYMALGAVAGTDIKKHLPTLSEGLWPYQTNPHFRASGNQVRFTFHSCHCLYYQSRSDRVQLLSKGER